MNNRGGHTLTNDDSIMNQKLCHVLEARERERDSNIEEHQLGNKSYRLLYERKRHHFNFVLVWYGQV